MCRNSAASARRSARTGVVHPQSSHGVSSLVNANHHGVDRRRRRTASNRCRVSSDHPVHSTDSPANATATAKSTHVFVSYASSDAAVAGAIVQSLERHGIACWIAPRDVKAGALYADAIVRAISGAKALVLVLSENAIGSSHVGKEIERASSKKRPIIALRIDNAPLTPALEYFLSESQWIEAQIENKESAYASLIDAIQEHELAAPEINPAVTPSVGIASAAHRMSRRNRMLLAAALAVAAGGHRRAYGG
jgi:TIR domain